jgi:hypothetical protein
MNGEKKSENFEKYNKLIHRRGEGKKLGKRNKGEN